MTRVQKKAAGFVVLVVLLLGVLWWNEQRPHEVCCAPDPTTSSSPSPSQGDAIDGLPTVDLDELPPEAAETVELIEQGGPFPYDRDGVTFRNDEGLLPQHERGYYREYTVPTPGEDDRGARRIVAGGDTLYWTPDHYRSFSRIVGVG